MDTSTAVPLIYKGLLTIDEAVDVFDEELSTYDTFVIVSYGYLGDLVDASVTNAIPMCFPDDTHHMYNETTGIYDDWSQHVLKLKRFSTEDDILISVNDNVHMMHVSALLTATTPCGKKYQAIYSEPQQMMVILDPEITRVLKNITFEKYVRSANVIKKAWRDMRIRRFMQQSAARKIQHAALQYLYRPGVGPMFCKAQAHFQNIAIECGA